MGPKKSLRLGGFACAALGAVIVAIPTVTIIVEPPAHEIEAWLVLGLLLIMGLLFLGIGVGMLAGLSPAEESIPPQEFRPSTGEVEGEVFHADSLSYGNVEVWIHLPQDQMRRPRLFLETWSDRSADDPEPADPSTAEWGAEQIQALFDLGASVVDVGCHSDCIQVTFPQDRVKMTRELAEQAAALMASLKRQALE